MTLPQKPHAGTPHTHLFDCFSPSVQLCRGDQSSHLWGTLVPMRPDLRPAKPTPGSGLQPLAEGGLQIPQASPLAVPMESWSWVSVERHLGPGGPILRSAGPGRECPSEPWYVTQPPEEKLRSQVESCLHLSLSFLRLSSQC